MRMICCSKSLILNLILSQVCLRGQYILKASQSQQTIYPSIISCFPQIKPEAQAKALALSSADEYLAPGIPSEWVEPLQKLGYTSIDKIKALEKPGKLHQEMMG